MITAALIKTSGKTVRMLGGAIAGAVYSMVIFLPQLNFFITVFGKLLASAVIILISFGFRRAVVFIKSLACFYFSNMVF